MELLPPNSPEEEMVTSLSDRRAQKNKALIQSSKAGLTRLTEVEAELSKLLDVVGDLERQVKYQGGIMRKLLEALEKERRRT